MTNCRDVAKKVFARDQYEIHKVTDHGKDKCLVDFRDKNVSADIDIEYECSDVCREYDEDSEEYNECYDECEKDLQERVDLSLVGSIGFWKDNLRVWDSTIPIGCQYVWGSMDMDGEEVEKRRQRLEERLTQIGCEYETEWIHAHEMSGSRDADEADPAVCYVHTVAAPGGKCRVDALLRVLRGL